MGRLADPADRCARRAFENVLQVLCRSRDDAAKCLISLIFQKHHLSESSCGASRVSKFNKTYFVALLIGIKTLIGNGALLFLIFFLHFFKDNFKQL